MEEKNPKSVSIVPIGSTGLVRVGKTIAITNKIISEHEERILRLFPTSIIIGKQEWMVKNLGAFHFQNGDIIPEAKTKEEWILAGESKKPVWCFYNFDERNDVIFGKLYNWYAVIDPRGLAPEGWHIPSLEEWNELTEIVGGEKNAGLVLKSKSGWGEANRAIDQFNFSAMPGGNCNSLGEFSYIGLSGYFWCSTQNDDETAFYKYFFHSTDTIHSKSGFIRSGISVRCIKDNADYYFELGVKLKKRYRLYEAIDAYSKALEIDNSLIDAYYNRANIKDSLSDFIGAIEDYTQFIKYDSNYPDAYCNRGYAKRKIKDYQGAINDYYKAIEFNSKDYESHNNIAITYQAMGKLKEALKQYSIALTINPNYAIAYNNRGYVHLELENFEDAIKDYSKAIEIGINHPGVYYYRGVAKEKSGDNKGAIEDKATYAKLQKIK